MQTRYRHTQLGTMILFAIGPVLMFLVILMFVRPSGLAVSLFAFMAIVMIIFSSMTVIINDQAVNIHFGPGLLRFKYHTYGASYVPFHHFWLACARLS